jgi:hypothetical protein
MITDTGWTHGMELWLSSVLSFWKSPTIASTDGPHSLQLEFPLLSVKTVSSDIWLFLFCFRRHLTDYGMRNQCQNGWEKIFFAMVKTELCLTGDSKYGLGGWRGSGGGNCIICPVLWSISLYKAYDIPLGEVSIALLWCGLNKNAMTHYFSSWPWPRPSRYQYCGSTWLSWK